MQQLAGRVYLYITSILATRSKIYMAVIIYIIGSVDSERKNSTVGVKIGTKIAKRGPARAFARVVGTYTLFLRTMLSTANAVVQSG